MHTAADVQTIDPVSQLVQPEQTRERGRIVRTPFCLCVRLFLYAFFAAEGSPPAVSVPGMETAAGN